MQIDIRPVRPGDLIGMTRVILAARGFRGAELEQQMKQDLQRFHDQGLVELIESEALVAMQGARMVGVMRYGEVDEDVHLTRPEIDPQVGERSVVEAFLQGFWPHMSETVERALFVDYPTKSGTLGAIFEGSGFQKMVDRLDMRLQLREEIAKGDDRLTFTPYEEKWHMRFLRAYQQSFTGSLDPMMDWDARHPEQSFETFRFRFGNWDPQMWLLATDASGRDVGFALFQYFQGGRYAGDTVLLYTAVLPEARGMGYGERIVREGLRVIRHKRGPQAHVSLTVSLPNTPAKAIYQKLGFRALEFSVYTMRQF